MKIFEGIIISTKMQKTVMVEATRKVAHPLYKKLIKRNKKYKVDSTGFSVSEGDRVKIGETKPISKDKHFKIIKVLAQGEKTPATTENTETKNEGTVLNSGKTVKKQSKTVVAKGGRKK